MKLPRLYPILDTESLSPAARDARNRRRAMARRRCAESCKSGTRATGAATRLHRRAHGRPRLPRGAARIFIVDDRADIALLLDAGLHVGQDDLPPRRRPRADRARTRCSASPATTQTNCAPPTASRWTTSPSARSSPPRSKHNPDPVVGIEEVRALPRACSTNRWWRSAASPARMRAAVLDAGADSVAVIGDLLPEPLHRRNPLRERMEEWQQLRQDVNAGPGQRPRPARRHHAGHGLHDRLGHLHRGGRYLAAGAVARPAAR